MCRRSFHAAAALRESVVRDWAALGPGPEGRTALRRYLLGYLAAAAEQPALQVGAGGRDSRVAEGCACRVDGERTRERNTMGVVRRRMLPRHEGFRPMLKQGRA